MRSGHRGARFFQAMTVTGLLTGSLAIAQDPTGHDVSGAAPETNAGVTPPVLQTRVEATFPPEALRDRVEGTVSLELRVEEDGTVAIARVIGPAGYGFDEAALAAAKQFKFTPAMQAGRPVSSLVQLAYEFHLPGALSPAATPPMPTTPAAAPSAATLPTATTATQTGPDQSTLVLAQRPISAASSFAVQDREFQLRPIGRVQDILRVTPGLVMVQHSGGGKANQYFLRRFDAITGPMSRCRSTAFRSTCQATRTGKGLPTRTSSSRRLSSGSRSRRARTSPTRTTSRPRAR